MARRIGRWKSPVLAGGREIVGRRPHPASGRVKRPVSPQVRAETVRGQRQVVVQTDGHSPVARPLLRLPQRGIDLPLQVLIKHDGAPVFLLESAGFRRCRLLAGLRPLGPVPDFGIETMQMLRPARSKWRSVPEVLLRRSRYASKLAAARRPGAPFPQELREQELEEAQLEGRHALVLHEWRAPQIGNLGLDGRRFS